MDHCRVRRQEKQKQRIHIMKKIIFATSNQDKMREIREILADMDVEVQQHFPSLASLLK